MSTDYQNLPKLPILVQATATKKSNISFRLQFIRLIPVTLIILLLVSFLLQGGNYSINIGTLNVNFDGFLRIISISGLIGFLTNWIAITMLFRPLNPRPVFGQGLIPAQKVIIAEKLANAVNKNLINTSLIRERLLNSGVLTQILDSAESSISELAEDPNFREYLYQTVSDGIRGVLSDTQIRGQLANRILLEFEQSMYDKGLERLAFKAYRQLRGNEAAEILSRTLEQVPIILYDHRHNFDELIEGLPFRIKHKRTDLELYIWTTLENLINHIDVKSIVEQNLNNYDEGRLEKLIKDSTFEQLDYIKYLGAVLGILGGLFIWNAVVALITVIPVMFFLVGLDILLSYKRQAT
jgi:uncharacterized membrane-anchored protein YjiN (DUF445 family)